MYLPVDSVLPLVTVARSKFAFFKRIFGLMARAIMVKGLLYVSPCATAMAASLERRAKSWLSAFFVVTLNEAGNVSIFNKEVRALALVGEK